MSGQDNTKTFPYLLQKGYMDAHRRYRRGEVVRFPEGKAPKSALLLTEADAKRHSGDHAGAAADPLAARIAVLEAALAAKEDAELDADEAEAEAKILPSGKK